MIQQVSPTLSIRYSATPFFQDMFAKSKTAARSTVSQGVEMIL